MKPTPIDEKTLRTILGELYVSLGEGIQEEINGIEERRRQEGYELGLMLAIRIVACALEAAGFPTTVDK